jgi:hypothetical protein
VEEKGVPREKHCIVFSIPVYKCICNAGIRTLQS